MCNVEASIELFRGRSAEGMKLVFVSSPLRSKSKVEVKKNIERAKRYCAQIAELGYVPVSPILIYPEIFPLTELGDEIAAKCCERLIRACDEVWLYPRKGQQITPGMTDELNVACKFGKVIKYKDGE